ncbi:MAG: aldehyde dehydrogenase family protein [Chloroflexi bacterium]|nr:aldehyde dehydrogenase family protein [Chloroflexota bacterium]
MGDPRLVRDAADHGWLDADAFVAPTVIGGVSNESRIAQEEVFGPVVTLSRFSDEKEADVAFSAKADANASYIASCRMILDRASHDWPAE